MSPLDKVVQSIRDKDEIHKLIDSIGLDDTVLVIITHPNVNTMSFGYVGEMRVPDMVYAVEGFKNCLFNRVDSNADDTDFD